MHQFKQREGSIHRVQHFFAAIGAAARWQIALKAESNFGLKANRARIRYPPTPAGLARAARGHDAEISGLARRGRAFPAANRTAKRLQHTALEGEDIRLIAWCGIAQIGDGRAALMHRDQFFNRARDSFG